MDEQEQQNVVNEEQQDINQMKPTTISPPPSHKKLIVGIVAIFILVLTGIAGAYFVLQPKSESDEEENTEITNTINVPSPLDDITFEEDQALNDAVEELNTPDDWKTYRNEEFGFEFQYPPKYIAGDLISPARIFEQPNLLSFISVEGPDNLPEEYTISLFSNFNNQPLDEWVNENRPGYYRDDVLISDITVCNNTGKQYASFKGAKSGVYFEIKDTVYVIEWNGYTKDNKEQQTQYNFLVSSFKCNLSVDTSNWETYQNEEFGVEFKYPQRWYNLDKMSGNNVVFYESKPPSGLGKLRVSIIGSDIKAPTRGTNISEEEFLDIYYPEKSIEYPENGIREWITINNFKILKYKRDVQRAPMSFVFFKDKKFYNMVLYHVYTNKDIADVERMLSTFKFIESQALNESNFDKTKAELENGVFNIYNFTESVNLTYSGSDLSQELRTQFKEQIATFDKEISKRIGLEQEELADLIVIIDTPKIYVNDSRILYLMTPDDGYGCYFGGLSSLIEGCEHSKLKLFDTKTKLVVTIAEDDFINAGTEETADIWPYRLGDIWYFQKGKTLLLLGSGKHFGEYILYDLEIDLKAEGKTQFTGDIE